MASADKNIGLNDLNYYIYDYFNRHEGLKNIASILKEKAGLVSSKINCETRALYLIKNIL